MPKLSKKKIENEADMNYENSIVMLIKTVKDLSIRVELLENSKKRGLI